MKINVSLNDLSLNELKEMEQQLEADVRDLDKTVRQAIKDWIESTSGIRVELSRAHLMPSSSNYMSGSSKVSLEYVGIQLVDENDKGVFGADLTLSWYGDVITISSGSCGEFVALGEQKEHDKYQVLKYKLLGILMQYVEELNNRLNKFDLSLVNDYYRVKARVGHLEYEERQKLAAAKRQAILDTIKVGNKYINTRVNNMTLEVEKITAKRVYFKMWYSTSSQIMSKFYDKVDIIEFISSGLFKLI